MNSKICHFQISITEKIFLTALVLSSIFNFGNALSILQIISNNTQATQTGIFVGFCQNNEEALKTLRPARPNYGKVTVFVPNDLAWSSLTYDYPNALERMKNDKYYATKMLGRHIYWTRDTLYDLKFLKEHPDLELVTNQDKVYMTFKEPAGAAPPAGGGAMMPPGMMMMMPDMMMPPAMMRSFGNKSQNSKLRIGRQAGVQEKGASVGTVEWMSEYCKLGKEENKVKCTGVFDIIKADNKADDGIYHIIDRPMIKPGDIIIGPDPRGGVSKLETLNLFISLCLYYIFSLILKY